MTRRQSLKQHCQSTRAAWKVGLLTALAAVSTARAQWTSRVEIDLGPCVAEPTKVVFVSNDSQQKKLDLKLSDSHWIVSLPEEFIIQDACAGLRLGGARTDCQTAVPADDPDNRYKPLAQFRFKCDQQGAWPVVIQVAPSIPVSYVRRIENRNSRRNPRGCPCVEKDSFSDGTRTLEDVRFPAERLLLQLGVDTPNEKGLGLDINTIKPKENPKKKDEYSFNKDGVAGLLSLQRVKGERSPPSLSSTAIDLDMAKLNKMALTKLTLTVN